MHTIEPFYNWRHRYTAEEDERSPFFGREHSEFEFEHAVYDHVIHPQWDSIGSETLYIKVIFADYDEGYAVIELIGEWNDLLGNDIMFLKRDHIEPMMAQGISKFILIGENVLNFHASDDEYYSEWFEEAADADGWIARLRDPVLRLLVLQFWRETPLPAVRLVVLAGASTWVALAGLPAVPHAALLLAASLLWLVPAQALARTREVRARLFATLPLPDAVREGGHPRATALLFAPALVGLGVLALRIGGAW